MKFCVGYTMVIEATARFCSFVTQRTQGSVSFKSANSFPSLPARTLSSVIEVVQPTR